MKRKVFLIMFTLVFLIGTTMVSGVNEKAVKAKLKSLNNQLAAAGKNFQIEKVEFSTHDEVGPTVYANNRQHKLTSHWVPNDPNRWGVRDIYWATENVDNPATVSMTDAQAALSRAMAIWNNVPCANIPLVKVDDYGLDLGYVQYLIGMGGAGGWLADITHAGWLPGIFFEIIGGPGGSNSILGVTFTFIWVDSDTGEPSDMDNNGREDVAFREIYYNDAFIWAIDERFFDIETIAAHEVGHGLSIGHFGKIFRDGNGQLHFAPRALMNAIYYDILQELLGTDNASFCSIWASWPNN